MAWLTASHVYCTFKSGSPFLSSTIFGERSRTNTTSAFDVVVTAAAEESDDSPMRKSAPALIKSAREKCLAFYPLLQHNYIEQNAQFEKVHLFR